jgi:hypothetical protein
LVTAAEAGVAAAAAAGGAAVRDAAAAGAAVVAGEVAVRAVPKEACSTNFSKWSTRAISSRIRTTSLSAQAATEVVAADDVRVDASEELALEVELVDDDDDDEDEGSSTSFTAAAAVMAAATAELTAPDEVPEDIDRGVP